jgi:soluble lytic murein transglycosylase-like protein
MNWRVIPILLAVLAPCQALAEPNPSLPPTTSQVCRQAIAAAERAHGIPPHLLAAIARVESGRRDEGSGTFNPWPWTINVDGQGTFYDNKVQAVAAAMTMRPRVTRSIDVGCMQISLTQHPDAFSDLNQAFDPASNADYGARFLVQRYGKSNSWPKAVALYHSATPDIGEDYERRVYAALPEEQKVANVPQPLSLTGGWAQGVNRSLLALPPRTAVPHIISLAPGSGTIPGSPPGRTLASYRATPVRLALRAP